MSEPRRDRAAARQWRVSAGGVARGEVRAGEKRKSAPKTKMYTERHSMTNRRIRLKPTCHCEERSDVAIRPPLRRTKTYCYLEKKRIPTTSDIGHWFRNDSGFLYSAVSFLNWHLLSTGAECKRRTQQKSPRRGRPPCRPAGITDVPKHYTTLPYFTMNHYIILSAKHKPRKNQIRLFLFIFMCYNSLCIGIILYFYERHTQWDFSIRFSAATMTVS